MSIPSPQSESIHEFARRPAEYVDRLHESGQPLVLKTDGKPDVVVQDAEAYRRLDAAADELERRETIAAIRRGLADVEAGRTMPARDAVRMIKERYSLNFPAS